MKELKLLKWATFIFVIFFFTWSSIGGAFQEDYKPAEEIKSEYKYKEVELEDAVILGKYYNKEGYFIVVYNELIKAPEIHEVDFSEWELMDVGNLY